MASGLNVRLGTLACAIRRLARTKCESFNVSSSAVPRLAAGHAVVHAARFTHAMVVIGRHMKPTGQTRTSGLPLRSYPEAAGSRGALPVPLQCGQGLNRILRMG